MTGLVVPVKNNFQGFAKLMASVDIEVQPYVIPNWDDNIGVAAGWNKGIKQSLLDGHVYTIVVNDDVEFHPGSIRKLLDYMTDTGADFKSFFGTVVTDDYPLEEIADFAAFVICTVPFLFKYGYFDERFYPAYYEDNDMTYRMKLEGDLPMCYTRATFDHTGSQTIKIDNNPEVQSFLFNKNKNYYIEKWGGEPDYEKWEHPFNDPTLDRRIHATV